MGNEIGNILSTTKVVENSEKGIPNGIPVLDANGIIPEITRPTSTDTKKYVRKWAHIMKHS